MPKGIPKSGVNKGWFKKDHGFWSGKKRPDMVGNSWNKGKAPWNKGIYGTQARENHPQWKGGVINAANGYKRKRIGNGYLLEHRVLIEEQLGRKLEKNEVIHHINHNRSDNRLGNLMVFSNHSEHMKYHAKQRLKKKNYNFKL